MKTIAFIAGSGLAQVLNKLLTNIKKIENKKNKYGLVISYYIGQYNNTKIIILPRHGDSLNIPVRSPAQLVLEKGYEANIWELYKLKVDCVFGFSVVGSLDKSLKLINKHEFILPYTYLRGFAASTHTFGKDALNVHTNMKEPFNKKLIKIAKNAIIKSKCTFVDNVLYIYNNGDAFETTVEIKILNKLTKDYKKRVVGMTTIPEVMLCSQLNIPFCAICSNVNYAEGLDKEIVSHKKTINIMNKAKDDVLKIVKNIIINI